MRASEIIRRQLQRAEARGATGVRISIPRLRELLADADATKESLAVHRHAVEAAVKALRRADRSGGRS